MLPRKRSYHSVFPRSCFWNIPHEKRSAAWRPGCCYEIEPEIATLIEVEEPHAQYCTLLLMQNRYVGDIGDFGKYGLLRWIWKDPGMQKKRLGIQWYLTAPENNGDGGFRQYLNDQERYRRCDENLYDHLKRIQRGQHLKQGELPRHVSSVQTKDVFPMTPLFFDEELDLRTFPKGTETAIKRRCDRRKSWHETAVRELESAHVVFFDPDNGFERKTTPAHRDKGPKYLFFEELDTYIHQGKTAIIYQNSTHDKGGFIQHLQERISTLKCRYKQQIGEPYWCAFRSHGARAFIILPVGEVGAIVRRRAVAITKNKNWSQFFSTDDNDDISDAFTLPFHAATSQ